MKSLSSLMQLEYRPAYTSKWGTCWMHRRKCEVIHMQDQSRLSLSIKLPNNVHYIAEMNKWFPNANQLPTHINVICLCSRYESQYRLSPCSLYWCAGNNECNGVGIYDITFGACCSNVHCAAEGCRDHLVEVWQVHWNFINCVCMGHTVYLCSTIIK